MTGRDIIPVIRNDYSSLVVLGLVIDSITTIISISHRSYSLALPLLSKLLSNFS